MDREPITPEGYARLVKEIEQIKSVDRPRNIAALEHARSLGDLSENADYDAAKNEQGMIAARLAHLEDKMARAEIIDPKTLNDTRVMFGATVSLEDLNSGDVVTYQIVSSYEADSKAGRISLDSPIGKALIGREEGDEVVVGTPSGKREFGIQKVDYK